MSFDYGFTCPDIDSNIDDTKEQVHDFLLDLYRELNPLLEDILDRDIPESVNLKAKEDTDYLYSILEDIFENVRNINEDMRKEADTQISELKDRVYDLESEVERLESGE